MNGKSIRIVVAFVMMLSLLCGMIGSKGAEAKSSPLAFVVLSDYAVSIDIGESFYLTAIATNGEIPKFKSSSSKIASVNAYGKVTGKQAGTATITAKVTNGEASCRVRVKKTSISLSTKELVLEHGQSYALQVKTSIKADMTYRSSKSSVVSVDNKGRLTALKPGEAWITVRANGSSEMCKVTVKQPDIVLSQTEGQLYRGQTLQLKATVSSGLTPVWKSSRSSVATVDEKGLVTAVKNGTAIISAKVDGVTRSCTITVNKPVITLSYTNLEIKCGKTAKIKANVSSGNVPVWTSSNSSVVSVDSNGKIKAYKKGIAYITAKEDGAKARCKVVVKEVL